MQQSGDTTGVMAYLSDHPATQDRVNHVNAFIASQHLAGTELGAAPYARIRGRLAVLPTAAPAAPGAAPAAAPPSAAPPAAAPPAAAAPAAARPRRPNAVALPRPCSACARRRRR